MTKKGNKVAIAKRRQDVLEGLLMGLSERKIAEGLKVSHTLVNRDKKKLLAELDEENKGIAEAVRNKQISRYDRLLSRWWPQVADPKKPPDESATYIVLKILESINKLHGVVPDKPLINIDNRTIESMTRTVVLSGEHSSALGHKDRKIQSPEDIKQIIEGNKPS